MQERREVKRAGEEECERESREFWVGRRAVRGESEDRNGR